VYLDKFIYLSDFATNIGEYNCALRYAAGFIALPTNWTGQPTGVRCRCTVAAVSCRIWRRRWKNRWLNSSRSSTICGLIEPLAPSSLTSPCTTLTSISSVSSSTYVTV